jgi:hypothetical protein
MRITSRCAITESLMGQRATSESARLTELAAGTTSITAPIIARQRREEKRSAPKERRREEKCHVFE